MARSTRTGSRLRAMVGGGSGGDLKRVELPSPAVNPHNMQATKFYIFNETGNIMLATTDTDSSKIEQSVRDVFAEVSVFFAAMTRAISTTINPATKKPYSLYNYTALQNVIDGSGLFIHVTEEDVVHTSTSFGVTFSKDLIEALLGLATGAGEMSFASAMLASIGKEGLNISANYSSSNSKVANIVFVCEYLLGMPVVSAIVVYADVKENEVIIKVGPCFSSKEEHHKIYMHKDTYMFVTPAFIKEYAADLESVESDAAYIDLVEYLRNTILQNPVVGDVYTTATPPALAPSALTKDTIYQLQGSYLGDKQGKLQFAGQTSPAISVVSWQAEEIQFKVSAALTTASAIEVIMPGDKTAIGQTARDFTVS